MNKKIFVCVRYYAVKADTEEEAKDILRNCENDLDYLKDEEWEGAPNIGGDEE